MSNTVHVVLCINQAWHLKSQPSAEGRLCHACLSDTNMALSLQGVQELQGQLEEALQQAQQLQQQQEETAEKLQAVEQVSMLVLVAMISTLQCLMRCCRIVHLHAKPFVAGIQMTLVKERLCPKCVARFVINLQTFSITKLVFQSQELQIQLLALLSFIVTNLFMHCKTQKRCYELSLRCRMHRHFCRLCLNHFTLLSQLTQAFPAVSYGHTVAQMCTHSITCLTS